MPSFAAQGKIRVGIVGASADPFQWGATAHIPALRSLPEYEVVAVAATRQETANAAAKQHGVAMAFGDYQEMVNHPDIDMICVITTVLHHHRLVMAALEAGKHVFCEWPLGVTTAQAIEMRDLAEAKGVRTLVGLQNRCAPVVRYVRDLIAEGFIGELLFANLARTVDVVAAHRERHHAKNGVTDTGGPLVPDRMELGEAWLYMLDKNRANSGLSILGGHALDTFAAFVGEFVDLQAYTEVTLKEVIVRETGQPYRVTAPDSFLVQGRLAGNAVAAAQLRMNAPIAKSFHLEISGSKGALIVSSNEVLHPSMRHAGIPSEMELSGTPDFDAPFRPMSVPAHYRQVPEDTPSGQPFNVAQLYRSFSNSVLADQPFELDFRHGVMRHLLLDTVQDAADNAARRQVNYTN